MRGYISAKLIDQFLLFFIVKHVNVAQLLRTSQDIKSFEDRYEFRLAMLQSTIETLLYKGLKTSIRKQESQREHRKLYLLSF